MRAGACLYKSLQLGNTAARPGEGSLIGEVFPMVSTQEIENWEAMPASHIISSHAAAHRHSLGFLLCLRRTNLSLEGLQRLAKHDQREKWSSGSKRPKSEHQSLQNDLCDNESHRWGWKGLLFQTKYQWYEYLKRRRMETVLLHSRFWSTDISPVRSSLHPGWYALRPAILQSNPAHRALHDEKYQYDAVSWY